MKRIFIFLSVVVLAIAFVLLRDYPPFAKYALGIIPAILIANAVLNSSEDIVYKLEKDYLKTQIAICFIECLVFGGAGAIGAYLGLKGFQYAGAWLVGFACYKMIVYMSVKSAYYDFVENKDNNVANYTNADVNKKRDALISLYNRLMTGCIEKITIVIMVFAVSSIVLKNMNNYSLADVSDFLMILLAVFSILIVLSKLNNDSFMKMLDEYDRMRASVYTKADDENENENVNTYADYVCEMVSNSLPKNSVAKIKKISISEIRNGSKKEHIIKNTNVYPKKTMRTKHRRKDM